MKYIRKPIIVDATQNEDTTWTFTSADGTEQVMTNEQFEKEYAPAPHMDVVDPNEEPTP